VTGNRAPAFNNKPAIRVVPGQSLTMVLDVEDDDLYSFRLETNIPAEQYSFGEYTEFFNKQQC